MKANVRFDHDLIAVETENHVSAMLEIAAPPVPGGPRPPLRLALVVDRSGSMAGEKLETARGCARFLAERLTENDSLAIVSYGSDVTLALPLAPVDRTAALHAIDSIASDGMTNLSGGWLKGVEELRRDCGPGLRQVLLLSDGLANEGITSQKQLADLTCSVATDGVTTTTIGFGDDFDEDLLTAMADRGRGNAHYAATLEEAPRIFADEFDGISTRVAQNVSVEIRPADEVGFLSILNDYPCIPVPGGVQLQLGDAFGDEQRRVIFDLAVPSVPALGVHRIAEIILRYVSVGAEIVAHETTIPLTVNLVSADEAAAQGPDHEVVDEIVVLKAAKARRDARDLADAGDYTAARRVLSGAAEDLRRRAPRSRRAQELLDDAASLDHFDRPLARGAMPAEVRKNLHYDAWRRNRGRRPRP